MSSVKGTNDLVARLISMSKEFETNVKEILELNIGDLEFEAVKNSPGGGDLIRTERGAIRQDQISPKRRGQTTISQGIGYELTPDGLTGRVFVEKSVGDIAAYVEFGTGQSAANYLSTVEPEWREQARKYYVNGKGTIIQQAYLYPAYLKYRKKFVEDLKRLIAKTKF